MIDLQNRAESLSKAIARFHEPVIQECDELLPVIEGSLPDELRGVLYRNGPASFERGGVVYGHDFDGDGMITRFAFGPEGVRYRNRYVRTREYVAEEAADRILYRGFGTNVPGGALKNAFRLRLKNAANTSVLHHSGRLLALWEGGLPHEIDPDSLETLGPFDFSGRLRSKKTGFARLFTQELTFAAHPKVDPTTGEMFGFGILAGRTHQLLLYRVNAQGQMDEPESIPLDGGYLIHDFAISKNWRVFFLNPMDVSVRSLILGTGTIMDSVRADSERPVKVLLASRSDARRIWIDVPFGFILHIANAHEVNGSILVEGTRFDTMPPFYAPKSRAPMELSSSETARLMRWTIDPNARTVVQEQLCETFFEFPQIPGRLISSASRYVYGVGLPLEVCVVAATRTVKFDTASGRQLWHDFQTGLTSEPIFVPRPGATEEDDGWLLVPVYWSELHRSDLYVLDAKDLSTVCRVRLPHHHFSYHGTWVGSADLATQNT